MAREKEELEKCPHCKYDIEHNCELCGTPIYIGQAVICDKHVEGGWHIHKICL